MCELGIDVNMDMDMDMVMYLGGVLVCVDWPLSFFLTSFPSLFFFSLSLMYIVSHLMAPIFYKYYIFPSVGFSHILFRSTLFTLCLHCAILSRQLYTRTSFIGSKNIANTMRRVV